MGGAVFTDLHASALKALLTHIDEGIHVVDRHGVTAFYNALAGLYDGLEPEEVVGKHLLQVFPSLDQQTSTILKVLASGTPILNQQQTFTNYKGVRVTTVNSTWPIFHGPELVGAVEISKDITRVRELSEQVVDLKAELLRKRRRRAPVSSDAKFSVQDLIGTDPKFEAVKQQALRAARGSSPILVSGETGTGKELVVHAIHNASPRKGGPLVAQNCAALPESLLEGLLFGTTKGSFTGAEDRPGLFELADGGTLYLDELNSMDLGLQAKLLRVLQDGRIRRLGDSAERSVDVRVITSTNEDPIESVQAKRLRQDLYYRLNVVYLELPPLRDRRSDIDLLTSHFLAKHAARIGAQVTRLSPAVRQFFHTYLWPGNVRELEHAIEAGLHMARGDTLRLADLPAHLQRAARAADISEEGLPQRPEVAVKVDPRQFRGALAEAERQALESALHQCGWNLSKAARLLGIPRQTLQYRIKVLQLQKPGSGEAAR